MRHLKLFITAIVILLSHMIYAQELLTLDAILQISYSNSPEIKTSELDLIRGQESLIAQKARMKSQLKLDVSPVSFSNSRNYSKQNNEWYTEKIFESGGTFSVTQPLLATNGTLSLQNNLNYQQDFQTEKSSFSNNVTLNLSQPIFTYNEQKVALKEVELDLENSLLSYALQKLSIEKNVTQYFYNVFQKQQNLLIAQEEYNNQKESYKIIKGKVDAGLSPEEELWQSDLDLTNSQSTLYTAEVDIKTAEDQLKRNIGADLTDEFIIMANVEAKGVDVNMDDAIIYAKQQRLEIRQAQISIENREFDLIRTKTTNQFEGKIDLSVGLNGLSEDEGFSNIYSAQNRQDNEQVSLTLSIPIFDWGERKAMIKASEAQLESSKVSYETELTDIEVDIRQIYRNLNNYLTQIEIAKKKIENAERTYELNLERYRNGDLTSLDLSKYQEQLTTAKNASINAKIDYKLEILNLKIQTLWDFETNKSIVPDDIKEIIINQQYSNR